MDKESAMQPEEGFRLSGRITNILNNPIPDRKISLLAQGDYSLARETYSNASGQFAFTDLPLRGTTKLSLWAHEDNGKIDRFNVGFALDPQHELQKPKVYAPRLPQQSIGVMALLENFRHQKELEEAFLDSLKHMPGMEYMEEVSITRKPIIKNSYTPYPGQADIVLDEKAMGKFDRFSNLLEVLEHEIPGFRKGYHMTDKFGTSYFATFPRIGYSPAFHIGSRRVIFGIDGGSFPHYGSPTTPQGLEDRFEYEANLLRNIPVSELVGVEVFLSPRVLDRYGNISGEEPLSSLYSSINEGNKNICGIEITTKEGKGIVRAERTGKITTYIRGVATPRIYYVPKYVPTEFPDRLTYHRQPTLLWVPELITSEEGKAEVSLPVGRNFARTLRVRVESYSPTGMVGSDEVYLPVGREKGTW